MQRPAASVARSAQAPRPSSKASVGRSRAQRRRRPTPGLGRPRSGARRWTGSVTAKVAPSAACRRFAADDQLLGHRTAVLPGRRSSARTRHHTADARRRRSDEERESRWVGWTARSRSSPGRPAGMGRVAAERFAAEGARVAAVDRDDSREARSRRSPRPGARRIAVAADVTDAASVEAAVAATVDALRRAARPLQQRRGEPARRRRRRRPRRESTWDTTMDVNVKGVWLCCRHGIPAMLDSGGGSIINVASFVAHLGAATPQLAYTTSKGAVLAMTREIAVIYARAGHPGQRPVPRARCSPRCWPSTCPTTSQAQRRLVHIPMGRFGEAEEMVQRRAVPGLRRVVVHDRPVAAHRRRHHRRLHHAGVGPDRMRWRPAARRGAAQGARRHRRASTRCWWSSPTSRAGSWASG